jgi:hypothetical protein
LTQAVDDFLTLLQLSTFEKRDWLNDGRRAVFHETARTALAAGTLQLLFIEIEGRKAATLFNFDYKTASGSTTPVWTRPLSVRSAPAWC